MFKGGVVEWLFQITHAFPHPTDIKSLINHSHCWICWCFRYAALKEMATHSSVLAWRIPGMGEAGGLPPMGSHRVGHNWSDLAAALKKFHRQSLPSPFYSKASCFQASNEQLEIQISELFFKVYCGTHSCNVQKSVYWSTQKFTSLSFLGHLHSAINSNMKSVGLLGGHRWGHGGILLLLAF